MQITARIAGHGEVPLLVDLMEEFYAESGYALDREWARASFRHFLSDPSLGRAWVLFDGAKPAGYVVLTVRFAMEYGGLEGFIDDLYVRPAYRRHGIARHALNTLFEECRRRGIRAVQVEVGRGNAAANALYASFNLRPRDDDRVTLVTTLHDRPEEPEGSGKGDGVGC